MQMWSLMIAVMMMMKRDLAVEVLLMVRVTRLYVMMQMMMMMMMRDLAVEVLLMARVTRV